MNKVKVGFFSFTEILDGRHREYNEWHLFDHMPEQFKLDGLQWGQRWVATPALMQRRLYADDSLAPTTSTPWLARSTRRVGSSRRGSRISAARSVW